MKNTAMILVAGLLALSPMSSMSSFAQEQGTETERQSCEPDVNAVCKDAIPDKPRIIACLVQNVRRLSPACANVIRFYTQQRLCAPDAAQVCAGLPATDRVGVVKCLEQNRAKLQPNCRNALKTFTSGGQ